ncbi:MAG: ABC transporter permease [Rhodospirillaceae bacterium]
MRAAFAIILMNLGALRTRLGSSAVVVLAVFALAGISTAMLSIATGYATSQANMKRPNRAVILSASANFETQSSISRNAAARIGELPGVARDAGGKPLMTTDAYGNVPAIIRETNRERGLSIRGTTANVFEVRPEYKIVEGRMFTPGLREFIVGQGPHDKLLGLNVGDQVLLPNGPWTIVGVFACGGRCEWRVHGDVDTVMAAFNKTNFNTLIVSLEDESVFAKFQEAVAADPTINAKAERETDYWERTEGQQSRFYQTIGLMVGGIIGLGVAFASANMMYAAVSRRLREIATLRALGFGTMAVVSSVLTESLVLAAIGAVLGIAVAWLTCDGLWYMGANFNLAVTPGLAFASLAATLGVGALAALFPAIRAARMPVANALQVR